MLLFQLSSSCSNFYYQIVSAYINALQWFSATNYCTENIKLADMFIKTSVDVEREETVPKMVTWAVLL